MFIEVLIETVILMGFLGGGVVLFYGVMKVISILRPKPKMTGLVVHMIDATYGKGKGWSTPVSPPKNEEKKPS